MSATDRSRLLTRLAFGLEADADAEEAWGAVAELRDAELESGSVHSVPLEEAMARLQARFPG